MKKFADASFGESSFFEAEECLECVVTNPYRGKLPAFDWCGKAGLHAPENLRGLACALCHDVLRKYNGVHL
eukprot:355017-Chlamydomonas_euryale.AAC.7